MKKSGKLIWLSILSDASALLRLDPADKDAACVLNIAGSKLIKSGYPHRKTDTGYEIMLGDEAFSFSGDAKFSSDPNEAKELAKLREAFSCINNALNSVSNPGCAPAKVVSTDPVNKTDAVKTSETDDIVDIKTDDIPAPETSYKKDIQTSDIPKEKDEYYSQDPMDLNGLITNNKQPEHTISESNDSVSFVLPETPTTQKKKESVADMSGYKESLEKNDFLFAYHDVIIHQPDSSITIRSEVIISPLYIKEGPVDVLAWINDGIKTETAISKNGRKSVLLQLGPAPLIASGHFENGKFTGEVALTKTMKESGVTVDVNTQTFDGKGHIMLSDDGIEVRMVPCSFENGANGNAGFFYAITQPEKDAIVGDNMRNDEVRFDYNGAPHRMLARWKNNVLYSSIRPV